MALMWTNDLKCLGATPSGRSNASIVQYKRNAIVYGGLTCNGPSNEIFMVDMDQLVWRAPLQHGSVPLPRHGHSAVILASDMLVYGGITPISCSGDLCFFNIETGEWSFPSAAGNGPGLRYYHRAVLALANVYVFGGCGEGGGASNDFFKLETETLTWSIPRTSGRTPPPRQQHVMCGVRDTIVIAGGWNGVSSLADVHVYDLRSCSWSETETKGVTWNGWAGPAFALASDGVSLLVFGGHSSSQMTNESRIFNTDTSSWITPPIVGSMPPECANACAVVHTAAAGANGETSCRLLVFGGSVGDGVPAMRVHGIDYAAFLKSQAVPVSVSLVQHVDEQKEPYEPAVSAADAGSASVADDAPPAKSNADKQRPKNDGNAAEKKPKEKAVAAPKGGSVKRHK